MKKKFHKKKSRTKKLCNFGIALFWVELLKPVKTVTIMNLAHLKTL